MTATANSIKTKNTKTIGIVIPSPHESCQSEIWQGIVDEAAVTNTKIITFVASSQDTYNSCDAHYNVIKTYLQQAQLDGLIFFSGAMAEHCDPDIVKQICASFYPLPTVCVCLEADNCASVLVDNKSGIVNLINHLVKIHHCKNIAFIQGPPGLDESKERYEAYKKGLENNNLKLNPNLVFPGNFSLESGVLAAKTLHNKKIRFDAVMAADDETAFGALTGLIQNGYKVPKNIAVVGFDDVGEATVAQLTTIKQPRFEQGKKTLDTAISLIDNKETYQKVLLPTQTVYRKSCGCPAEPPTPRPRSSNPQSVMAKIKLKKAIHDIKFSQSNQELADVIEGALKDLELDGFLMALYETPVDQLQDSLNWQLPQKSIFQFGYLSKKEKLINEQHTFLTQDIFPPILAALKEAQNLLFLPLFHEKIQLGFLIFKHQKNFSYYTYEELRLTISKNIYQRRESYFKSRDEN